MTREFNGIILKTGLEEHVERFFNSNGETDDVTFLTYKTLRKILKEPYSRGILRNMLELIHEYYSEGSEENQHRNEPVEQYIDKERELVNMLNEFPEGTYTKVRLANGHDTYMLVKETYVVVLYAMDNKIYVATDESFGIDDNNFVGSKANEITVDTAKVITQLIVNK